MSSYKEIQDIKKLDFKRYVTCSCPFLKLTLWIHIIQRTWFLGYMPLRIIPLPFCTPRKVTLCITLVCYTTPSYKTWNNQWRIKWMGLRIRLKSVVLFKIFRLCFIALFQYYYYQFWLVFGIYFELRDSDRNFHAIHL